MKKRIHRNICAGILVLSMCFSGLGISKLEVNADNAEIIKDDNGLYTVIVDEDLADGKLYENSYEKIVVLDSVNSIGKYAFANSHKLKEVELSNNIDVVANGLCYGCENLAVINLDNVKEIGSSAFFDCKSLDGIKFSDELDRIGSKAFAGCSELESVKISGNVEKIEEETFKDCVKLSDIEFNDGLKTIEKGAFTNCVSIKNVKIPDGLTSIENVAFKGCSNLLNVEVPESVKYISSTAFADCGSKLVIVGSKNSYAHEFAVDGIKFSETCVSDEVEEKINISSANVSLDSSFFYYDGKKHKPKVTVKLDGETLKQGVDYSIVYTGYKRPGNWEARVLGEGNYKGSQSKNFKIMVTPVKNFRVKNVKKHSILIKARKYNAKKNITGYQIAYKAINGKKYKKIKTYNTGRLEYVLGKFKKNKTYQVRVRCFVKTKSRSSYSVWSPVKQVRIKK